MTWSIRHEGSPQAVEGLTLAQLVEGLQDGLWEPTDEVKGPNDRAWVALESHPQFQDLAADLELARPKHYDDETHLDMNPLIDVCLVLLVFFILTTSYAALQKVLDMPRTTSMDPNSPLMEVTEQQAKETTIKVTARKQNGEVVLAVEDEVVKPDDLQEVLSRYTKGTGKKQLLLDASPDVDWGTIVHIEDAANGAGFERVHFVERKQPAAGAAP